MDFDIFSPIGDRRPLIRIKDRTGLKVDLLDIAMNALWLLIGSSPMLALIAFELWGW